MSPFTSFACHTPADLRASGGPRLGAPMPDPAALLIVDLEDALLRPDDKVERFWLTLAADPVAAGRRRRSAKSPPAFCTAVLARIEIARASGAQVRLLCEDAKRGTAIAKRLGLQDAVIHAPRVTRAACLQAAIIAPFTFLGSPTSAPEIWGLAARAIVLNTVPDRPLMDRLAARGLPVEHLAARPTDTPLKATVKAMRPHQWLKNVLIFIPLFTAHRFAPIDILHTMMAFVAFSLTASSVYVLNDLLDLNADRAHPRKRARPLAAGTLSIAFGTGLAPALAAAGLGISALISPDFLAVLVGYYILTTAYSLMLKRKLVIDIITLAVLYTARILAGGVAMGASVSVWLLAFSIFLFLSLAAIKRQAELQDAMASGRRIAGRGYRAEDLPLIASMATSAGYVSVLVLALYLNSSIVRTLYSTPMLLWGICIVLLYWISPMVMLAHRGQMHDDPVVFAARDRVSWAVLGLIALLTVAATL